MLALCCAWACVLGELMWLTGRKNVLMDGWEGRVGVPWRARAAGREGCIIYGGVSCHEPVCEVGTRAHSARLGGGRSAGCAC